MKKSILIMSIMAFVAFGCSNEGVEIMDQNLAERDGQVFGLIKEVSSNQEFRNLMNSRLQQRSSNANNGNGVMVIENGFTIIFGVQDGDNVYFLGPNVADDYIAFMPNGTARFFAHSSNPIAFVLDLTTFSTSFSNGCMEGTTGRLNASVSGTYELLELPFGNIYFIDQPSTADVLVGHSEVSDAQPIYDEEWNQTGCTDATDYKTMRLKMIFRGNSNQEHDPIITASLE